MFVFWFVLMEHNEWCISCCLLISWCVKANFRILFCLWNNDIKREKFYDWISVFVWLTLLVKYFEGSRPRRPLSSFVRTTSLSMPTARHFWNRHHYKEKSFNFFVRFNLLDNDFDDVCQRDNSYPINRHIWRFFVRFARKTK